MRQHSNVTSELYVNKILVQHDVHLVVAPPELRMLDGDVILGQPALGHSKLKNKPPFTRGSENPITMIRNGWLRHPTKCLSQTLVRIGCLPIIDQSKLDSQTALNFSVGTGCPPLFRFLSCRKCQVEVAANHHFTSLSIIEQAIEYSIDGLLI